MMTTMVHTPVKPPSCVLMQDTDANNLKWLRTTRNEPQKMVVSPSGKVLGTVCR